MFGSPSRSSCFGQVFFGVDKNTVFPGGFPFPGGKLLGFALLVNLLAAHIVRFKLTWKRSGIFLIHGGLILMMVGEFITRQFAIEGNLTVPEGKSTNYVESRDNFELALITSPDGKTDKVIAIPGAKLQAGHTIAIPNDLDVPLEIAVDQLMGNSQVRVIKGTRMHRQIDAMGDEAVRLVPAVNDFPANTPKATGLGQELFAVGRPQGVGVDTEAKFDAPSAYITVKNKDTGEVLDTYLVSTWMSLLDMERQKVKVDGKTYELVLRFKRMYKPYSMYLHKVSTVFYDGSDKPKEYNSVVQLIDPSHNENRKVTIEMNRPLRYRGETFYQSGVNGRTTILQVVRNPGWLLPYVSCIVVALGMIVHFTLNLTTFLKRRAAV